MKKIVAVFALVGLLGATPLPDGSTVTVMRAGIARVWSADRRTVSYRKLMPSLVGRQRVGAGFVPPSKAELLEQLRRTPGRAFPSNEVIVQFRTGIGATSEGVNVPAASLAAARRLQSVPAYTNSAQVNRTLATLGVDRMRRLALGAYHLHVTASGVRGAVAALLKLSSVSYASPNWYVATMRAPGIPVPVSSLQRARNAARTRGFLSRQAIPTNYAVSASAQSLLNAPGIDAIGAYDEISQRFRQLPGEGELITNVSLGDLDDASALGGPTPSPRPRGMAEHDRGGGGGGDPCAGAVSSNGPTTELIGGQRYIDWPAMPLIPTYVADASGNLSGSAEVCNSSDPVLSEVGLDFSVMAPLPHERQRPANQGSGFTDLLGIAPGASYRLIVPANPAATIADIDAALLAAAQQMPHPNVITASLGFGLDGQGFPSRYLEEDPLTNAIVTSIVRQNHIVVCIAANDGLRVFTNAAIPPSGGSAATNVVPRGGTPTDLNDLASSTAPSLVPDSGAIDAGGTTLDDIFSAPPQDPHNAQFAAQHAFPVTRYNGETVFSSGFGSRVNVSAPADNITAVQHSAGGSATQVDAVIEAGTSASAPETAAAAAVALQIARLTGHPLSNPLDVRTLLSDTGSAVPNVPQSDENLHVGSQIDLTRMVESLIRGAGTTVLPSVARVAVEQRRAIGLFGGVFLSDTDPTDIDLAGPLDSNTSLPTGDDQLAWITIAPDWEGVSPNAQFRLIVENRRPPLTLARTRWVRLLPRTILAAAGLPLTSASTRTVRLTYEAKERGRAISIPIALTFGPSDGTTQDALAPVVDGVVRGNRLSVTYDLTGVRNVSAPLVVVSSPGRVNPSTGFIFHPQYVAPLSGLKGTVQIPVDKLQGDGVYGIAIGTHPDPNGGTDVSDFAYTHVLRALDNAAATAPLLSYASSTPGHFVEIPTTGSFTVSWDVSNISGANGALIEVSAPGPNAAFLYNTFNNPGGTIRDNNGVDAGSVYAATVYGRRGSVVLDAKRIGMVATFQHAIRVIPLEGGVPAGEGGAISTVAYDGVVPLDGGNVGDGFAVNSTGDDGYLTSQQVTAEQTFLSSIETFTQSTSLAKLTASSSTNVYFSTNSGEWAGDIGIAGTEDLTVPGLPASANTYRLLNPVAGNAFTAAWQPPALNDGVSQLVQTAPNAANDIALLLTGDPAGFGTSPYQIVTSNLAANTFGPTYNITAALPPSANPFALSLAQDTSTQTGLIGFADFSTECGSPALATIDLTNGHLTEFAGVGSGFPLDAVIDSTTHLAAYQTSCDQNLNVLNVSTHAGFSVTMPGQIGLFNAADPVNHLIAAEMVAGDSPPGNNNQMSAVYIFNEHGGLIKKLETFNLYVTGLPVNANDLQLNFAKRRGYIFGPLADQLEPFSY